MASDTSINSNVADKIKLACWLKWSHLLSERASEWVIISLLFRQTTTTMVVVVVVMAFNIKRTTKLSNGTFFGWVPHTESNRSISQMRSIISVKMNRRVRFVCVNNSKRYDKNDLIFVCTVVRVLSVCVWMHVVVVPPRKRVYLHFTII